MSALAKYGSVAGVKKHFDALAAEAIAELKAECIARGHMTLWKTEPSDRTAMCFDCRTTVVCEPESVNIT